MKRSDDTLTPEAERELEAVERVLAGLPVEEEAAPIAALVADVRAERPEPDAEWAAELDRLVVGGFAGRPARAGLAGVGARLGSLRLRSVLVPAGALATLAVVVAVGVGVTRESGSMDANSEDVATMEAGGAEDGAATGDGLTAKPGGAGESALPVPDVVEDSAARQNLQSLEKSADIDASAYPSERDGGEALRAFSRVSGGTAPGQEKRQQDRSAYLSLKTETSKVREVSDEAIQITESAGGVVLSSSLSEERNRATASLELSIPTRELDATLDRLTDLATVASLNEAAVDITKPFVSAEDALKDARAEREQLLQALAEADTETEADAIQAQLDDVREEISRAEATFENIARRARLATVSLQIEGTPNGDDDGEWGLGDAAEDALDALKTVAGVLLVGAAIVLPILALAALIAWLILALRKRSREKALDD